MSDDLSWHVAKFDRIAARKKHYSPDAKPPQKQCKDRDGHLNHMYECDKGLIWSCQGRGWLEYSMTKAELVEDPQGE
jgi:hypothetical protein